MAQHKKKQHQLIPRKRYHLPRATMLLQTAGKNGLHLYKRVGRRWKRYTKVRNKVYATTKALWRIPKGVVWKG